MKQPLTIPSVGAALFDLDGVILDTESQYNIFWEDLFDHYYDGQRHLAHKIKGQTLVQIYDEYFSGPHLHLRPEIDRRLEDFEHQMQYPFIPGAEQFIAQLREQKTKMAVVTSSNQPKMQNVYRSHPELRDWFDAILTSEDFTRSKPDPQCYLRAAERLGCQPQDCVVFEDSFNGLRSARASGARVVALATTNPAPQIAPLADLVVSDFTEIQLKQT